MRIYTDLELTKEIKQIYFGKVEVGSEKTMTLYLFNESTATLSNLVFKFPTLPPTEVLQIVHAPVTIHPKKVEALTLTWKPSAHFKQALSVELEIKGEEIYLAKQAV